MHIIPVHISPEECGTNRLSSWGVKKKRGTLRSPVSFGGWSLVKVEGALVLAVRSADHKELSSSIFLVLGFRTRNAIAALIAQFSFADTDGGNLIGSNTKVF